MKTTPNPKHIILTLVVTAFTIIANANVSLANIFTDNMVLQRDTDLKIWGYGTVGENLTIKFNNQTVKSTVGANGKWQAILKKMSAGGPFDLEVIASNKLTLLNILIGDVWICSGQSNMHWNVKNSKNAKQEIANANYPNIRLLEVPQKMSTVPLDEIEPSKWHVTTPESVEYFSAIGYFFGRDIHKELNVPIGLIMTSWGGTCVETWTSEAYITKLPNYENIGTRIKAFNQEAIEQEMRNTLSKKIGPFPAKELGYTQNWMLPDTNRDDWRTMQLPNLWEDLGYDLFDGVVWFSYDINLTKEEVQAPATLHLGKVDNSDVTWVNGIKVGGENWAENNDRVYNVPQTALKIGKNNITIRVDDRWGKGGFNTEKEDFLLKTGSKKHPISGLWKFKVDAVYDKFKASPNEAPSLLYNAMIHPLTPFAIKGAIWYQGEANASRAKEYALSFPNMINNWRNSWAQGDFPFLWVQLANFKNPNKKPTNDNWAELRESQTKTLKLNNSGMALAIDKGEANNIHPANKQDVARRLAIAALKVAYNKKIVHSGPKFKKMKIKGNKAILSFDFVGSGLVAKGKDGLLNEFEIAGEDKKFYWAKAIIKGENVLVYADEVKKPIAVRFAWSINPAKFNFYNKEELPAIPFRTDDWKGITDGKTFE